MNWSPPAFIKGSNLTPALMLLLAGWAEWGGLGSAPGQFNSPTGIAVTDTEVFVSDSHNARIQVFDSTATSSVSLVPRAMPRRVRPADEPLHRER